MRFLKWLVKAGIIGLVVAALAATGLYFYLWIFMTLPANTGQEAAKVSIEKGMSAESIAQLLQREGVVTDAEKFYMLYRFHYVSRVIDSALRGDRETFVKLLQGPGAKKPLQAGDYAFPPFVTPVQVLHRLQEGKVIEHKVTFPEGSNLWDVARILEEQELADQERILELAGDEDLIRSLELNASSLEGYLFPETYFFRPSHDEETILRTMVDQFRKHFKEEWRDQAREAGLTVHEAVILASLVESEARVDEERPRIAAVFLNRLEKDMPLQSDPTAVYDLPHFSGPITRDHLDRKTPYNTYQKQGLPAGPICNPGAKSLEAVLYPEDASYLYFVSNNDGTHRFSETWSEHVRAVRHYREKRQAAMSKE